MEQILTIKTWAYDPEMARDMSMTLIDAARTFINSLNTRAERDIVRFAEAELNAAAISWRGLAIAMTDWRTASWEVDPVQTAEAQLRQIALLEGELSQIRADIIRLQTNNVSGPRMQEVRSRETALEEQIRRERRRIFEERTGTGKGRMSEYERLVVESEIAAKHTRPPTKRSPSHARKRHASKNTSW